MNARTSQIVARETVGRQRPLTGRGRDTRLRLLEACIVCLNTMGYAATTTQAVAGLANVSRGSLLHQFPTRVDMMAVAADYAMAQMIESGRERLAKLEGPVERLRHLGVVVEETQREPAAVALSEILLAARWEEGLAGHLGRVAVNVERVMDADVMSIAREAGIADPEPVRVRSRVLVAAMRGFAIELMFNADRAVIHEAIRVTRADFDRFVSEII